MLRAEAVTLRRGAFSLAVPQFRAAPGEIVALLGLNGSGKSTWLLALAGILRPVAGTIRLGGGASLPPAVAYLPARAEDVVLGARRLLEVALTLALQGRSEEPEVVLRTVEAALDLPREDLEDPAEGTYRALCGLLATGAACLLLDEPTAALGPRAASTLRRSLRRLADQGMIVVCATHDPEIGRQADRCYRVADGGVQEDDVARAVADGVLAPPGLWPAVGLAPLLAEILRP